MLHLTLRTDLETLLRDRDTLDARYHPATLTYAAAGAVSASIPIKIKTRGYFRRRRETCDFPPLRMKFDGTEEGAALSSSPFAGQETLKLVVTCQSRRDTYEQYLLQEFQLYRIYHLLTPLSFRVRLARITYEDTEGEAPLTRYAFFMEDEDRMAERNGGMILDAIGGRREHLVDEQTALLAAFQYLIGNTDWSIGGLHNVRLVQTRTGGLYPVPYDFDWSGVIETPYAYPDERLPIRSVRERLYRGYCVEVEELRSAFDRLREKRSAIYELAASAPDLEPKHVRRMHRYFDRFYEIIDDPRALRRELKRSCLD